MEVFSAFDRKLLFGRTIHNDISATIRFLLDKLPATQSEDQATVIQLLAEQLKLISTKKERLRYSVDFMVFTWILFLQYRLMHTSTFEAVEAFFCNTLGPYPMDMLAAWNEPSTRAAHFKFPQLHGEEDF